MKGKYVNHRYLDNNQGNVSIIMCVGFVIVLSFAAFVIDVGKLYIEKQQLENGIDAAALAAIVELPRDKNRARVIASDYLVENDVDISSVTIDIAVDGKSLSIVATRDVPHYFATIFGIDSSIVGAKIKAIIGPASSAKGGIRPFAVKDFPYSFGDLVTLKEEGGDGTNGNYGVVALGGNGASVAKDNIMYGYDGILKVGDIISTEPGNMTTLVSTVRQTIASDPTCFVNATRASERVWTIPIIADFDVSGRDDVEISGFAQFYIESIGKVNGKVEVKGRFMEFVTNGDIDFGGTDYGVYAAKLVAY